jgi:hypothetical protein
MLHLCETALRFARLESSMTTSQVVTRRNLAPWLLALAVAASLLALAPAQAGDKPKRYIAASAHYVPPGHRAREYRGPSHRWHNDRRSSWHSHSSHWRSNSHYGSHWNTGSHHYRDWRFDSRSGRYFDPVARIWISPYQIELRYGSPYRYYDSRNWPRTRYYGTRYDNRYGTRYGRYDDRRYDDCDDDRGWDDRGDDRWRDRDWDD